MTVNWPSSQIPPPSAVAMLFMMVVSVSVMRFMLSFQMAPPPGLGLELLVELPDSVQSVTVAVPSKSLKMPPPASAELPETVVFGDRHCAIVRDAAADGVPRDRGAGDRHCAIVPDAAAPEGGVPRDRGVGDRQRALVVDAAAQVVDEVVVKVQDV